VIVTQEGDLYLGILWDTTSTTIHYYNAYQWERLLGYLRGNRDRPMVSFIHRKKRYFNGNKPIWRDRIFPISSHRLDAGAKQIYTDIQAIIERSEGPVSQRKPLI